MMNKVCLIEDEKSLADLIALNLELEGYEVMVIPNGRRAIEMVQEMKDFNLIILDVMLPEISGFEICKAIRKSYTVPILFLSAKGTTEDRIAGLKLGANDYLSKPFDLEELLLRVQNLIHLNRKETITGVVIGSKKVDFTTFEVEDLNLKSTLVISKKEKELLKVFIENEGRVISRDELLDKVWGRDQFPTSRTVDNYILALRKIFEPNPKEPIYFHSIRSVGYKFTNLPK
jgi:two-component system alkaline phosphatase synthesis response regulator PhoP